MQLLFKNSRPRNIRRTQGRPLGLALEIAAKLGCIQLEPKFYESSSKLRMSLAVPHDVTARREGWKGEASAQLRRAFPGVELSKSKSHRIRGVPKREKEVINEIIDFMNNFKVGKVCVDGPLMPRMSNGLMDIETTNEVQVLLRTLPPWFV